MQYKELFQGFSRPGVISNSYNRWGPVYTVLKKNLLCSNFSLQLSLEQCSLKRRSNGWARAPPAYWGPRLIYRMKGCVSPSASQELSAAAACHNRSRRKDYRMH
ncbi:hypothetical protein MHYP_G00192830 [Metynnis hypsauchen]